MKSKWTKPVLDSLIHASAWWFAWLLVLICISDSPSRYVYAIISAWWCALYVGYIREIGLRSLLPLFVISMNAIIISEAFGAGGFLDGPSEVTVGDLFFATVLPFIFFSSPVLINSAVRYAISRIRGSSEDGALKSRWTKPVLDSLIHFSAWCLAWLAILFLETSGHYPSGYIYYAYVYATISAWWCALYVGYIREIGLRSLLPLFVVNIFAITISRVFGLGWFMGGYVAPAFSEDTLWFFIAATAVWYAIISSPIIINSAVRYVTGWVRENRMQQEKPVT